MTSPPTLGRTGSRAQGMVRALLRAAFQAATWTAGAVLARLSAARPRLPRLCIVRTDAIGDFVIFAATLSSYRRAYPAHHITLVTQDLVADLAGRCPFIDRLMTFTSRAYRHNPLYRLVWLWGLHRQRFSLVLNPMYSRDEICDQMVLWSAAPEAVGWDTEAPNMSPRAKARGDGAYTRLVRRSWGSDAHEAVLNRAFVERLGPPLQESPTSPCSWAGDHDWALSYWKAHGLTSRRVVCIVPEAGQDLRQWPRARFAELVQLLASRDGRLVFLLVGARPALDQLNPGTLRLSGGQVMDTRGTLRLDQLMGVLRLSALVVGVDTGPMHMAISCGTRTVCILGGGHFGRFMPYGSPERHLYAFERMDCYNCSWNCIYPVPLCIHQVSVQSVLSLCARQLWGDAGVETHAS